MPHTIQKDKFHLEQYLSSAYAVPGTMLGFLCILINSHSQKNVQSSTFHSLRRAKAFSRQRWAFNAHAPFPASLPAWVLACISLKHVRKAQAILDEYNAYSVD